jgi:hypothetical protein
MGRDPGPSPSLPLVLAEERAIGGRVEHRRNVIALGIAAVVILGLAAFLYRPAMLIGVHGDALAHSVGGASLLGESSCTEQQEGIWQCRISDFEGGIVFNVQTHGSFGCWEAVRVNYRSGKPRSGNGSSGCISGLDVFSLF